MAPDETVGKLMSEEMETHTRRLSSEVDDMQGSLLLVPQLVWMGRGNGNDDVNDVGGADG